MNVFGRPVVETASVEGRVRAVFFGLFLLGVGLRGWAACRTLGVIVNDEHQQFLEQAQRMAFGYGHHFWEQERGARHPLYPALLAGPLAGLDFVGVRDSLVQGALLRWLVSVLALLACALFAWEFQRRGDALAALGGMSAFALLPDFIYPHIHPLSETAASIPFLFALLLQRSPRAAGAMMGLAFGIRFQMGFFIAPTLLILWISNRARFDRPFLQLLAGLTFAIALLGLSDRWLYGAWFHSPITYYRANIVEGVADYWGVEPWYQYLLWLGEAGWITILPPCILFLIGFRQEWRLGLMALGFILPHMLIGHKEGRFLLPAAPIVTALVAVGFSRCCANLGPRSRGLALGFAALALLAASILRIEQIQWNREPYRATAHLLHEAGRRPDLTGVVVLGPDRTECGNYFYLRRDVPLIVDVNAAPAFLHENVDCREGKVNYLICPTDVRAGFDEYQPAPVAASGTFTLYRLANPTGPGSAQRMDAGKGEEP